MPKVKISTIVVDGETYYLKEGHWKEDAAQRGAQRWRAKGYNARVKKKGNEWRVYARKRKR